MQPPQPLVQGLRACAALEGPHDAIALVSLTFLVTPRELADVRTRVSDGKPEIDGVRPRRIRLSGPTAEILRDGPTARAFRLHEPGTLRELDNAVISMDVGIFVAGLESAVAQVATELADVAPSQTSRAELVDYLGLGKQRDVQEAPWVRATLDAATQAAGWASS